MSTSHTGVLPLLQRILAADTSPLGMTFRDVLDASGLTQRQCSSGLNILRRGGRCAVSGTTRYDRYYYASPERLAACAEAVAAYLAEVRRQRKERRAEGDRVRSRRRYANKPKAAKPPKEARPKPAKPVKAPKARPDALPATVTIRKTPAQRWANAEPIIPPGVTVTVCPTYRDTRFAVDPSSVPRIPVQQWGRL